MSGTFDPELDELLHKNLEGRNHFDITRYLEDLEEDQVRKLGGSLGLLQRTLKKMKDYPDDLVSAWLRRQDNVLEETGEPTFEKLAIALESIGQNGLAQDVRQQKYAKRKLFKLDPKEIQVSTHPLRQQKPKDPVARFGVPCSEGNSDIKEETTDNVEAPDNGVKHKHLSTLPEDNPSNDRIQSDFPWPFGKRRVHEQAIDRGQHIAKLKLQDNAAESTIIKPKFRDQPPTSMVEFYEMKGKRHGVALIINNKIFKDIDHKDREGTDRDEYNLIETWLFLGYHIVVLRNCAAKEMTDTFSTLDDLLKKVKNVDHDSFVCCILSHGEEGRVYGSDSSFLTYNSMITQISQSRTLHSKPKLLFIQACQGGSGGGKVIKDRIQSDDGCISEYTDFYLSWATVDGAKSYRDIITGSWYIYELCKTLCEYGKVMDLDEIQKTVNERVVKRYAVYDKRTQCPVRQQPQATDRLRKKVFFFHE